MDFITANKVAELTGHASGAAFLAARARLERDHAFPSPLPTCLRPLKWRRAAVVAWMAAQGGSTEPVAPRLGELVLLGEARRS